MGRFKKDDRSLIEIGNDNGDHWVAEIPTSAVKETEKALRKAGCERDDDDDDPRINRAEAERMFNRRDHDQPRYRSARVVDEEEDLEDNHDRELEADDYEENEQPAWRWWK